MVQAGDRRGFAWVGHRESFMSVPPIEEMSG